jgi:hypothetical protein
MASILLKTTIPFAADDWHIGRFAMLRDHLTGLRHAVTARNRMVDADGDDIDLAGLAASPIDQLWLFAVECHAGLTAADAEGIARFRARGGGVLATRDHQDLGACLLRLGELGAAHHFQTLNPEADADRQCRDDVATASVSWPNYHSGANGDCQPLTAAAPEHPLLRDGKRSISLFPAHPHEGAISPPVGSAARVIARGVSAISGRPFNLVVAFEGTGGGGRGLAHSSFHHFCDYNWDPRAGCPSFVAEPPADGILRDPLGRRDIEAYVRNVADWLSA